MNLSLGNMLGRRMAINPDGLSLDLQFADDKTLTARKGPTPVFTRASTATYYGPLISRSGAVIPAIGVYAGRTDWQLGSGENYTRVYYVGNRWEMEIVSFGEGEVFTAALGNEWRPDQANWSDSGTSGITTSSTFGLITAATNEPRFDHDTTAPNACKGLLIESSRTNLVFPSATLTTQTRTVTAASHTLSFYGTGTVFLTGAHGATVSGTGAYPTRTTLTFTPSAGSLVLTVTGSVTQAQLEVGAFATSYIPTTTASVVRSADVCSITGGDFSGFYNNPAGTLLTKAMIANLVDNNRATAQIDNGSNLHVIRHTYSIADGGFNTTISANDTATRLAIIAGTASVIQKRITAYEGTSFAAVTNGGVVATATRTMPLGLNAIIIGNLVGGSFYLNGHIAAISFYKKRLPDAKIQALTA